MNKRIKNKNAAWLKEWHALLKESQRALTKAEEINSFIDCKASLLFQLEEKVRQHADLACQAAEQHKQMADKIAEKKDHCNTVAVVVLLLLLPLCGVLLGYYLATVTH